MRSIGISLLFLSGMISTWSSLSAIEQGVTYSFSGGRFGDQLLCYLHAKWISYREHIPLIYKPFSYSSLLKLNAVEIPYETAQGQLRYHFSLEKGVITEGMRRARALYIVPYFPEDVVERLPYSYFDVDWKDAQFRSLVLDLLSPIVPIETACIDPSAVNVAIHVREGGGFDNDHTRYYAPTKLPPMSFYIEQLQKTIELFPQKKIYCHIFTDAIEPEKIAQQLEMSIGQGKDITFKFRTENNRHDANVLEDFLSLLKFDVLIRPQSNFSIIPSLLKDYAVLIYPISSTIINHWPYIDQTKIEIHQELYQTLLANAHLNHKPRNL